MWYKYFVLLGGFLLLLGVQKSTCFGSKIDYQFPLGTIGCLFVEKDILCGKNSRCIDDFLFGTCAGDGVPENFVYMVNEHDLAKLLKELVKLKKDKFSWLDGYTQCIIQNVILSLSLREPFSKKICYDLIFDWESETENAIASALGDLFRDNMAIQRPDSFPVSRSQKRDEIIRVHKYFDKSKGIHKRLIQPTSFDSSYLSYYPKDDLVDLSFNKPSYYPGQNDRGWEDSGIPMSDFQMVKNYLEATRGRDLAVDVPEALSEGPKETLYKGYSGNDLQDDLDPGYQRNDGEDIAEMSPPAPVDEEDALPPYYANVLDQLIKGEVEPENLTDNDLGLLLPYVTKMLLRLSELGVADDVKEEQNVLTSAAEQAMEAEMQQDPNSVPYGTEEEDMMMNNQADIMEALDEAPAEEISDLPSDAGTNDEAEEVMVKKTDEPADVHEAEKTNVVNTNVVYIEMDHVLNDADADKIMDTLTKDLKANPGSLNNYRVNGNKLLINVDTILAGVSPQDVMKQADSLKSDFEKATGYKFRETGIGDGLTVGYKNDDRYFVLTFVLCGCIAGILLAVVVIYLIKRNTRSKEKLQQIATVQEGNEAASKDYQDLCRQRMQSKSSEKPEPLHAASRVGSVSESQVRSPSSRSSTSSWSEEPVNSNMDISTGHIVLSYMEDHLKNKDRLDREWEAMCAYEADPCSTKVAEDQANMRKNRYSDVLPYDHSRVVLTTNTNVSGSDYINASSITDHDPRNPAYIATQGPLPHTVADFWQMVWEQGSVVIVMLSKLTENGEAKCHRYWPEEGSDLYHIYEVHLVSEHIWCEDYLVRSFYLKNLQTSETRTVTQFHFLTWPDLGIPGSIKALLDFRRKVNKSYRGRSCPIVVHCSDGCGRTGTYSLVDMVLNRMAKGAKEIDIAATLEHIRDQRMNMVKTKEQFQFALAAVAEEVHAILKALPQ